MRTKRAVSFVSVIVTALVMVLGCGSGLPGIVRTVVGADHVCTCASGGSHASCPVCNPSLLHEDRGRGPALEGVPCGEGRLGVQAAVDPAVIPESRVVQAPSLSRVDFLPDVSGAPHDPFFEPWTPPPRFALFI